MQSPTHHEHAYEQREHMSAGRYAATRISTLKPPMAKAPNPFTLVRMLNVQQWMFFLVAFFAWSWDAFDFFTVSLTVSQLAKEFHKTNSQITWGITLVLMFRSVGSIIFGKPKACQQWNTVLIIDSRYCFRSIWEEMALCYQQHSIHHPRARNRVLSHIQAILGLQSPFRSCHGRLVWQCCSNSARRLSICRQRTPLGDATARICVWLSFSDGLRPRVG